ncbi:MAG: hypothetical protein SPL13_00985 [Clostridia bacterium]|nr:hypothetical protein [Clostridia bacterium]
MIEKEELIKAITAVKEDLNSQENDLIKLGIYMAVQTIKDNISDEGLLKELGLDEDLEKYL